MADAGASARGDGPWLVLAASPAFASHGSKGLIIHSSRFVLVDRRPRIRAYHRTDAPESLARLRDNLRTVLARQ